MALTVLRGVARRIERLPVAGNPHLRYGPQPVESETVVVMAVITRQKGNRTMQLVVLSNAVVRGNGTKQENPKWNATWATKKHGAPIQWGPFEFTS
jgi:GH25 family lysozyme M1 (1,4-beta-N-acetylmuramidase)